MKPSVASFLTALLLGLCAVGCGDNISEPSSETPLNPPRYLLALSVDASTVRLKWSPPAGSDSLLKDYVIVWGNRQDSVQKNLPTGYTVSGLPSGVTLFTIYARGIKGQKSDPASISWAPADRYDSAFVLFEYDISNLNRASGMMAGSRSSNPKAVIMDPNLPQSPDFYLTGPAGQPLELRSASLYLSAFKITLFSSVVDASPSLDNFLASFPADYAVGRIQVQDGKIYYARVSGDQGEGNYIRVHIHYLSGVFPNRSVEVRLSLQRVGGLLYASTAPNGHRLPLCALTNFSF